MLHSEFATFAVRFNLTPREAVAIPATFEKAAELVGLPVRALLSRATFTNRALGEYLADVARTASAAL